LQTVQSAHPTTPVLVVASEEEDDAWHAFLQAGADELISPASLNSPAVLKRRIESAFAHARSESEAFGPVIEAEVPVA
jgi:DNA-binding NarL/FixJ family response regulator